MIVEQLNTFLTGGAATAALRLHESLLAAGVESRLWSTREPSASLPSRVHKIEWGFRPATRWGSSLDPIRVACRKAALKAHTARQLAGRPTGLELFTTPWQAAATPASRPLLDADVIHLHWVAKMIDYESFFASVPDELPIVWTLHDMNPFSGGCHYAGGCEAFRSECRNCPQLGRRGARDLSQQSFQAKLRALHNKNLHIVTPSHWLERLARQSCILAEARSFRTIHNGLDVQRFVPRDKRAVRKQLGLPADKIVIGFGAETVENQRKGLRYLLAALARLQSKQHVLGLVFGGGEPRRWGDDLPQLRSVGFVHEEHALSAIYSALDLFVLPSLEDNSPQTGVEAMACGVPVVAFDVGGIPDYVRPHKTGLLARPADTVDLARRIDYLVARPTVLQRLGGQARQLIEREFHHAGQAGKYQALYESLVSAGSAAQPKAA